jgi:citrate lyase subunit beta/citryl-CoA lyase
MVFTTLEPYEKMFAAKDILAAENAMIAPNRIPPTQTENRSYLMLSANRLRHLNRLDTLEADNVIINLEDGVAPEEKRIARGMAALFISHLKQSHARLIVRVNPLGEGGEEDIALINRVRPDAIRIPKVRTQKDAARALALVDGEIAVHFSIETKEAFQIITDLRPNSRITTFYLGILDLLADLKLPHSLIAFGNPTMEFLLAKFLIDCKTAGVTPVGFTYQEYTKKESFRHWCRLQQTMGYRGISCISPDQIRIAHAVFGTDIREIEKARYIIDRFEAMARSGVTGFTDPRFGFIDEPIYKGALALLNGHPKNIR